MNIKKYISIVLIVFLLVSLISCKNEKTSKKIIAQENNIDTITDTITSINDEKLVTECYYDLPKPNEEIKYYKENKIAIYDDMIILIGAQGSKDVVPIDNLKYLFKNLNSKIYSSLSEFYNDKRLNQKFNIDKDQISITNNYYMYKHKGSYSYVLNNQTITKSFVSYVSELKNNGAYVYWVAIDTSNKENNDVKLDRYLNIIIGSIEEK